MEANKMFSKYFTDEQMRHLNESPYVLKVYPKQVHFTAHFKEMLWNAVQSGKEPREAISDLGIDPDVLGDSRINGMIAVIKNNVLAGKGFRDMQTKYEKYSQSANPEIKIKSLEQQLAYKDQEIEFLKKIVSLGKEASES
jgi:hypothetical protein